MTTSRLWMTVLLWCCVASTETPRAQPRPAALEPLGTLAGAFDTLEVDNGLLFTSAGRTISIFDVGNPAAPTPKGSYTFPEEVWSFSLVGRYAYVGANFFGLGVLDVSRPESPTLAGSFKTPGQAKAVAVAANRAAIIDHMEGLVFVDVSTPSAPKSLGTFFVDGYGRDVASSGSYAYAVDSPSGLYVLDLSRPSPLEPLGSVQTGVNLRMLDLVRGDRGGPAELAVLTGGSQLQIYDVTTPSAPAKVSTFRLPGTGLRLTVRGRRVYVADGAAGLQIIDVSQPTTPVIVASHKTSTPARDVAVGNGHIFVATADQVVVLRDLP